MRWRNSRYFLPGREAADDDDDSARPHFSEKKEKGKIDSVGSICHSCGPSSKDEHAVIDRSVETLTERREAKVRKQPKGRPL